MTWQRREFLQAMAAAGTLTALHPRALRASDEIAGPGADIVIDARGRVCPAKPSPIRAGGTRTTQHGSEVLRFTNLYMERTARVPGQQPDTVRPVLPVAGEFHFSRYLPDLWEDELRKMKACGINLISTYLFWILHEPMEGHFEWRHRRDLRRFLEICRTLDLEVILRVGPFAHGEMRNGGLPDWLYAKPFAVRSNDAGYLACVQRFYAAVAEQVHGLRWQEGGPIVAIQLENEFMTASSPWELERGFEQPIVWIPRGTGGAGHMLALKKMAVELGLTAPIFTATGWGCELPPFEFLPLYGGYGFEPWSIDPRTHSQKPSWTFLFRAAQSRLLPTGKEAGGPDAGQIPFGHCELGGGMQCFYLDRFVVPADSVQATAITALGSGSSLLGYYMFHGGSNPAGERVFYGEYDVPRISYDFQAPIRETGQIAESYRALRLVHLFLGAWGNRLAPMQTVIPADAEKLLPEEVTAVRCAVRTDGHSAFLFINNYQDHVPQPERRNLRFRIQLDERERTFSSQAGVGLASGESAVFPLHFALGKLTLAWATVQPITELVHDGVRHVFFFVPRGVKPELAIFRAGLQQCNTDGDASVESDGLHQFVRGSATQAFHVRCKADGEAVYLHVLPRADALRLARLFLGGQQRIVLTSADPAEQDSQLILWSRENSVSAAVFPPLRGSAPGANAVLPPCSTVTASAASWKGGVTAERSASDSFRVMVAADAMDGIDNVLLSVEFVGDIGQAFVRGELVADNFANGVPWEIGLRQIAPGDGPWEILLKVIPREKDSKVTLDQTVPHPERFQGDRVGAIDAVRVIPVYRHLIRIPESA